MGRHQDLAAHVPAFFDRRQLVLKMDASRSGGNHVLHELKGIEHATKTGFCIGNNGQEEIDVVLGPRLHTARPLNFIGALEGIVDTPHHGRHRVIRIERLIRVHGLRGVAISCHLPPRQVDRLQPGLGLLHGLTR